MTSARDLLDALNHLDEGERIEAKRGNEAGHSILETICAFANEPGLNGGQLLLGVARDELSADAEYTVAGISEPSKLMADLASQCACEFNLPVRPAIRLEELGGLPVVVVTVAEAQPGEKPVYFKKQGLPRGAYRRISSTDQRCTEDDLTVLYQGRSAESFDAALIPDASWLDLSPEAIVDYRQSRREANPDAEELRWGDEDLLVALGCAKRDAGALRPTIAGILLFGQPTALRRLFPTIRVDYIRVPGKDWIPDAEHRFDTIEIRDSLFRLIRRAQAAVLDDLPKAFGLPEGELQRQDKPLIPQRVIREAIVNAVMHRSYRSHSPIQIIRYSNRLEIRNPGFSLKAPEHLGEPGSQPRNPHLAEVLHETRFAETKGSGIRVMRQMMEEAGLEPPFFESDRNRDQFVARYFFQHFLSPESLDWLSRFKELRLSDADARALVFAREQGAIDNALYRELNRVDTLAASQALRKLRDAGLLDQRGRGSATFYNPTPKMLGEAGKGSIPGGQALPSVPGGLSPNPDALPPKLHGLSPMAGGLSPMLAGLPPGLAAQVIALGRRSPPAAMRAVILALCREKAWKTDELAAVLERRPDTLRHDYLRPMQREGLLEYTLPEEPRHPQQAYRAVKNNA